jgi:hypothetical protein
MSDHPTPRGEGETLASPPADQPAEPRGSQAQGGPATFRGLGLGAAIGAGVGLAFGTMLGNLALGLAFSAGMGTVAGAVLEVRRKGA